MLRLGSDPQKVFPFKELLNQLRKFGIYAMFYATYLLPILFSEIESMNENDQHEINLLDFRISDDLKQSYNKRVADMIVDMDQLGYI